MDSSAIMTNLLKKLREWLETDDFRSAPAGSGEYFYKQGQTSILFCDDAKDPAQAGPSLIHGTGEEMTPQQTSSPWGDPIRLGKFLGRLMADPRVPKAAKLKVAGAGLYTWIDGDIIADPIRLISGLGYVDDIILVVHGIKCLVAETDAYTAAELWPGDEASFKRTLTAIQWVDDQLYGRVRSTMSNLVDWAMGNNRGSKRFDLSR
jgi:uncharacterized membrane protein YkvA (DUF1232 family)